MCLCNVICVLMFSRLRCLRSLFVLYVFICMFNLTHVFVFSSFDSSVGVRCCYHDGVNCVCLFFLVFIVFPNIVSVTRVCIV